MLLSVNVVAFAQESAQAFVEFWFDEVADLQQQPDSTNEEYNAVSSDYEKASINASDTSKIDKYESQREKDLDSAKSTLQSNVDKINKKYGAV